MNEHADALYQFLLEAATEDEDGRLISREPLCPVLMERFGLTDPEARRAHESHPGADRRRPGKESGSEVDRR